MDNASSGDYALQVILNAAVEQELHGGPINDTTDDAEDISDSFISLTDTSQRGAVVGNWSVTPNATATMEGFETTSPGTYLQTNYTFGTEYPERATLTLEAAHDGGYGVKLQDLRGSLYRDDQQVHVQQGDLISVWVKSSWSANGWFLFGNYSIHLYGYDRQIAIQKSGGAGPGTADLVRVKQELLGDHWYRLEVAWEVGGTITARLYDSDGATLLNSLSANDNASTSGGIGFACDGYSTEYFDTDSERCVAEERRSRNHACRVARPCRGRGPALRPIRACAATHNSLAYFRPTSNCFNSAWTIPSRGLRSERMGAVRTQS